MRFWVVRDKDGDLWLTDEKPDGKLETIWCIGLSDCLVKMPKELFPTVKWEDEEPTEIEIKIVKKENKRDIV